MAVLSVLYPTYERVAKIIGDAFVFGVLAIVLGLMFLRSNRTTAAGDVTVKL